MKSILTAMMFLSIFLSDAYAAVNVCGIKAPDIDATEVVKESSKGRTIYICYDGGPVPANNTMTYGCMKGTYSELIGTDQYWVYGCQWMGFGCVAGEMVSGDTCVPCPTGYTSKTPNYDTTCPYCADGYEMQDGRCMAPRNKCAAKLHVGENLAFTLWDTCTQPSINLQLADGICCADLEQGGAADSLNLDINGTIYHAVK